MRVIITGGHLAPALSVIKSFSKDVDILFVGRKYTFEGENSISFEYKTAEQLKIPFLSITAGRLQRRFTRHTILSLLKFPVGFFQALLTINRWKPDVILAFGGYISLPVIFAGFINRIPIVIHEQTFSAGLANRIASFFATKICISWQTSSKIFPKSKTVFTGLPLREFNVKNKKLDLPEEKDLPMIFVTGGSAGSHMINLLIEGCLEKLLEKFTVFHQTGDSWNFNDFERLNKLRNRFSEKLKNRYKLTKFINSEDMGEVFKKARLVVSRSGINTVAELIYFGKPAILIPLNNEQKENASFLKLQGQAEVEDQENLTSEKLYKVINEMIFKENNNLANKNLIIKDAAERIKEVVFSLQKP